MEKIMSKQCSECKLVFENFTSNEVKCPKCGSSQIVCEGKNDSKLRILEG